MEYKLNVALDEQNESVQIVLILVLMEYKWNAHCFAYKAYSYARLNPCFNGIQMERSYTGKMEDEYASLNPCFNGIQMEQGNDDKQQKKIAS